MTQTVVRYDTKESPLSQYESLALAYEVLNRELFGGELPLCVLTFQRAKNTRGYFSPQTFSRRPRDLEEAQQLEEAPSKADEIALNPDHFRGRSDIDILSTLAHEMAHCWQQHKGKPGRGKYHNREWARKMVEIGLEPESLDNPGKQTGQAVTHSIIPGGPFETVALRELAGARLDWQSAPAVTISKVSTKVVYTCIGCGVKVWGKPLLNIICGDCGEVLESPDPA